MYLKSNVFIICCVAYLANALYEDQVGKFDWKQSYVGKVIYSSIDSASKSVFVATEDNVVASINLLDGTLKWRKVLETSNYGKIQAFSVGNEVVTVSGIGPYLVRGWNLRSGFMTYEWVISSSGNNNIHWTIDSNKVYQVRFPKDGIAEITAHHLKTGNPAGSSKTIEKPWLNDISCYVDKGVILCLGDGGVNTFTLSDSSVKSFAEFSNTPRVWNPLPSAYTSALLTMQDGSRSALVISDESLLSFALPSSSSAAIRTSNTGPVLISTSNKEGVFDLSAYDLKTQRYIELNKPVSYNQKLSDGVISSISCSSERPLDCFILIVGDEYSLTLIQQDKVLWVREEALANVITVEMLDLPVSDEEAAIEKEFANKEGGILGMFYRRVHSQCLQAMNFITSILGLKESKGESRTDLVKDPFGLHKLIIIVTKSSKVYGMENDKGDIVWQFHLKDLVPFNLLGELSVPLFIQRTSRHLPLPAICTLIFKQKENGLSALYVFNPITGQPLDGGLTLLDYEIKQSLLLPKENEEFIKGLLFVSKTDKVSFFPESTKEIALELHKSLYLFTVFSETGSVEGYAFYSSNGQDLTTFNVWNVRLSPPIIKVAIKNKAERVHSQGRVLGDRSVLYKYINPHLVAIATHTTDPVHKNLINIFLIDTVSGAVVFSVVHKRAIPPVHIVHSENWVVYSFFNDKSRRTEVISLDLYEGKLQRNTTEFSSLSYSVDPFIERQAYIFPHNVMAMRETITEKGITNKHVLVGVSTGNVIEVPWALLDPHRSPDGREEGVIPYTPDLSLPHEATLTYNHTLPLITGIHTSPSGLESTSLVLVYGLDLFYTRVAPSKTFDVLKDDFEYWLITLVLAGLISAACISKKLASRKALKQAWK